MKERPILFSIPMVQAILAGRKTQTRRAIVSPYKAWPCFLVVEGQPGNPLSRSVVAADDDFSMRDDGNDAIACPYGQPGDRLWVRETWQCMGQGMGPTSLIRYQADDPRNSFPRDRFWKDGAAKHSLGKWKPSIHMPRWASRITLEVTGVRVERLQDITESDAKAEGISTSVVDPWPREPFNAKNYAHATEAFADLWRTINGTGSWEANPWVWVVQFRRPGAWKEAVALAATMEPEPAGGRAR